MTFVATCLSILLCLALLLIVAYVRGVWLNLRARDFVTTSIRKAEAEAKRNFDIVETFYTKNLDISNSREDSNPLYSLVAFIYDRRHLIPFYQESEDNKIEVVYPEENYLE